MKLSATCLPGMEDILEAELKSIGSGNLRRERQAVTFAGDEQILVKALHELRSALRVFHQIAFFQVQQQNDLYRQLQSIPWEKYISLDTTFAMDVIESGGRAPGPLRFLTLKAKDSLVDYYTRKFKQRPSVDRSKPDVSFLLVFTKEGVRLYRDAAGKPLSQRGYRLKNAGAPLNECLAWGLIEYSGFGEVVRKGGRAAPATSDSLSTSGSLSGILVDPMCGSGTISIEAARYLKQMGYKPAQGNSGSDESSGANKATEHPVVDEKPVAKPVARAGAMLIKRKCRYSCCNWPDIGSRLAELIGAYERKTPRQAGLPWQIVAADLDPKALSIARENAARAGVSEYIEFLEADFHSLYPRLFPDGKPDKEAEKIENKLLILNPPYDMRLAMESADEEYKKIGDTFKQQWSGFRAHVFSANRKALKQLGLRTEKKYQLKNGPLEASYNVYNLY